MRLSRLTFLLFITTLGLNCKKSSSSTTPEPDIAGSVSIIAPLTGETFDNSLNFRAEGQMIDNNVLASARLEIRNKANNAILYQQTTSTGNVTFYRFLWNWTVTGITADVNATVRVIAIDKLGNQV